MGAEYMGDQDIDFLNFTTHDRTNYLRLYKPPRNHLKRNKKGRVKPITRCRKQLPVPTGLMTRISMIPRTSSLHPLQLQTKMALRQSSHGDSTMMARRSRRHAESDLPYTRSVGENIIFRPSSNWRKDAKEEKTEAGSMKDKLKDKKVKCRICNGEHFTARCPFKDTMAPVGEEGAGADVAAGAADVVEGPGGLGSGKSSYVPPHMRNGGGAAAAGDRMGGGKYERDDLATLRVTNVSEMAEEQELWDMFERFGRVTRVFLAKDRETGMAKGFAFISFQERTDAAKACEKMDGYGFKHLILRVEFAKKAA